MKKYAVETTVGIFVVIGLICIGYMTVKLGKAPLFGDDTYMLSGKFTTVTGLRENSTVEMHGIEVGRVTRMTMNQDEQIAVVEMRIKKGVRVYDDAIASIKTSGLIGDRFVQIAPGGSGQLLNPGAVIRDTESPIDIGELIGKYAFGDVTKKDPPSGHETP